MTAIKLLLALALVAGLCVAGWSVYRRLPNDAAAARPRTNVEATYGRATTPLKIVLGNGLTDGKLNSPVELYPFDYAAAQREYRASPKLAKQFDDYLARRLRGVSAVTAEPDGQGRVVVVLSQGNWWLRAMAGLTNGEIVEWRLPIVISSKEQTVELTTENAYERTKKF